MAENGADFIEVFQFLRDQGIAEKESYQNAMRVFRGSTPKQGPFTKDLSYTKGFVLIFNYIRLCVERGKLSLIPLLFCGKTNLAHLHLLEELVETGIVKPAKYLPPQFKDLSALTAWSTCSLFLNQIDLKKLAIDYQNIL